MHLMSLPTDVSAENVHSCRLNRIEYFVELFGISTAIIQSSNAGYSVGKGRPCTFRYITTMGRVSTVSTLRATFMPFILVCMCSTDRPIVFGTPMVIDYSSRT